MRRRPRSSHSRAEDRIIVVWTVYEMANRLPRAVHKYRALRRPHGDVDGETDPQGSV